MVARFGCSAKSFTFLKQTRTSKSGSRRTASATARTNASIPPYVPWHGLTRRSLYRFKNEAFRRVIILPLPNPERQRRCVRSVPRKHSPSAMRASFRRGFSIRNLNLLVVVPAAQRASKSGRVLICQQNRRERLAHARRKP